MRIIKNNSLEPYFNLAAEEYLLENESDDCFMLWRNDKTVVIGKNQNVFAEINGEFVRENNIAVVRRLTGGGAVFHDGGNVNFTFITSPAGGIDFSKFISPVCEMLAHFGIEAHADGRNDIIAGSAKISGNAQCVYDRHDGTKRLMHHGTLLFSADMDALSGALRVSADKLSAKGIKSVKSRVANIRDIPGYTGPDSAEGLVEALAALAGERAGTAKDLSDSEKEKIEALASEKYRKWEWNFQPQASFEVSREKRFGFGTLAVSLSADNGIITAVRFEGDYFGEADVALLEKKLCGTALERDKLERALGECDKYIKGSTPKALAELICD